MPGNLKKFVFIFMKLLLKLKWLIHSILKKVYPLNPLPLLPEKEKGGVYNGNGMLQEIKLSLKILRISL